MATEKTTQLPVSTPDNTPLPGGGSWRWDASLPGWVENPPYGETAAPVQAESPPISQNNLE